MGNKKTDEKVKRGISTPQGLKMSSGALLALTFILPPERKNKTGSLLIGNGQETFFFNQLNPFQKTKAVTLDI